MGHKSRDGRVMPLQPADQIKLFVVIGSNLSGMANPNNQSKNSISLSLQLWLESGSVPSFWLSKSVRILIVHLLLNIKNKNKGPIFKKNFKWKIKVILCFYLELHNVDDLWWLQNVAMNSNQVKITISNARKWF